MGFGGHVSVQPSDATRAKRERALDMLPRPRSWIVAAAVALTFGCHGRGKTRDRTHASARRLADERGLSREELLGKRLFEDTGLSSPSGVSCASCHDGGHAFQGNNGSSLAALARGSRPGFFGARNTPTLLYAMLTPPFSFALVQRENASSKQLYAPIGGLFWDGRASTLAEQAKIPILDAREMNVASPDVFVARVRAGPYAPLAREVLGARLDDSTRAFDGLADAIAAFESTARFRPFRSKFDDYLRGTSTLTAAEARGFALFKDPSKGNCISCHAGNEGSTRPEDWLFTDFSYSALGVPRNAALPENKDKAHFDLGLCQREKLSELAPPGVDPNAMCGFFRVPTLRNVAVTAPYMHNGVFTTLRDVVRFYVTRDTNIDRWYPTDDHYFVHPFDDLPFALRGNVSTDEVPYDRAPGETPRLDPDEIEDVVAFLGTLTDR